MNILRTLLLAAPLLLPAAACPNCFSQVPPQPADGAYLVSAALPDRDCFWLYLAELQADEDLTGFLERAWLEKCQLLSRDHDRSKREVTDGQGRGETDTDAPEVEPRGLVLRNPAAPEAWRDVVIPCYRDNMMDFPGSREHYYNLFLSVKFSASGITVRPGEGSCRLALASAPPRFWHWRESEAFLAELPGMLFGDPKQVQTNDIGELSGPMRERILSGRRMVVLHTDKGLPIAPHWECLSRMAALVGGQNMAYHNSELVYGQDEYERRDRELCGYPEAPQPEHKPLEPIAPGIEVQPVLDLPAL